MHPSAQVHDSRLGLFTDVGEGPRLLEVSLDDYSYCDRFADLAHVDVGRFSNIASFVRVGATDHPLDRASLHHFLYRSTRYWAEESDDEEFFERRRARRARIGHDTWLGHASQVKPEVTVGDGAVVASGAIVTRDVPPYTIVAGVPARVIRRRVEPGLAERLQRLAWWDWDHATLRERLPDFRRMGVEEFLDAYES
ncbi:chloramphenicol acetyltransferase [Brachybacterium sp. ACRRE]|nr:chloramphenicol acetyltransferase [Brachybacterium sp. ACRRE]